MLKPYYENQNSRVQIYKGDSAEVLKSHADNSVDSVVTDPPYGLSFMGKTWDYDVPRIELWREVFRVLKPGGHLLAFGGSRTYHRLVIPIEDAGFEIRDQIMWVYGSGFPKSHNVSKAIDKAGGVSPAEQAAVFSRARIRSGLSRKDVARFVGCTESSVRDWEDGRARSEGAPVEYITPSENYRAKLAELVGYTSSELRVVGVSLDRRGDGSNYGLGHSGALTEGGSTEMAKQWDGWGTALKPAHEPIVMARKPLIGTVAANVLEYGTGGINVDGCRVPGVPWKSHTATGLGSVKFFTEGDCPEIIKSPHDAGRFPGNLIHDGSEEVLAGFPHTKSGAVKAHHKRSTAGGNGNTHGKMAGVLGPTGEASEGSAARFFYCAKASKKDRGEGNNHPTVKPTDLMRYLCRLVTPPGGKVLDPFCGSGSTGKAAVAEGFAFLGVELNPEYCEISAGRIAGAAPVDSNQEAGRCSKEPDAIKQGALFAVGGGGVVA